MLSIYCKGFGILCSCGKRFHSLLLINRITEMITSPTCNKVGVNLQHKNLIPSLHFLKRYKLSSFSFVYTCTCVHIACSKVQNFIWLYAKQI